jgi:hypothetical protein
MLVLSEKSGVPQARTTTLGRAFYCKKRFSFVIQKFWGIPCA